MSILILILKIIGILFLILLILVALLLFHPIYYQIEGEKEEEISAHGCFWWIFQIFRLEFSVKSDDVSIQFRIFGFAKQKDTPEETKQNVPDTAEPEFQLPSKEQISLEKQQKEVSKPFDKPLPRQASDSGKKKKHPKEKKKISKKTKGKKRGFAGTWKHFRKELTDEGNRQAVSHLWQELWYLVSHLKPNYIESDISFSAGDPAVTGKLTGALSILPVLYRYDARVYPDFLSEEAYIRGRLTIKGHMALFHFVRSLIRLLRDENTKKLYDKIRK